MADYDDRVKRALDQSAEETRRYLRAEGATAERARIVADIRRALGLDDGRHARHNLDGALIDIEHTADFRADNVCRKTIRRVIGQLAEVERIIERGDHAEPEPARREDDDA